MTSSFTYLNRRTQIHPFFFFYFFIFNMTNEQSPLLQQNKPPVSRPKYKRRRSSFDPSTYNSIGTVPDAIANQETTRESGLNLLQILGLTVCMAGVQFTCKGRVITTTCNHSNFFFLLSQGRLNYRKMKT